MIKHIEIGGKSRPVFYSINALIEFSDITGVDVLQHMGNLDFRDLKKLRALIYVGVKHGAKHEGETVDFQLETIGDWMGVADGSINKIVEAFRQSNAGEIEENETEAEAEIKN